MTRLTDRVAAKARAKRGKERLRQALRKAETRGELDQERPQLRAQGLHVHQETIEGGHHLNEATRVSDLLGHFDCELEIIWD